MIEFLLTIYNSMSTPDLIGWGGTAFFIYGVWAIGDKKISGFYFNFLGNMAYLVQGFLVDLYSLVFLSFLLMLLNIRGVIQWRKND